MLRDEDAPLEEQFQQARKLAGAQERLGPTEMELSGLRWELLDKRLATLEERVVFLTDRLARVEALCLSLQENKRDIVPGFVYGQ